MANKLTDIQKQFKELHNKMTKEGLAAFKEATHELFNKYTNLEAFKWNQYTPSWNDGSPCVFSVNEDSLALKLTLPKGKEDWPDDYKKRYPEEA